MTLAELTTYYHTNIDLVDVQTQNAVEAISTILAQGVVDYAAPKSTLITDDGSFFGIGYTSDPSTGNKAAINGPIYVAGTIETTVNFKNTNPNSFIYAAGMHNSMNYGYVRTIAPSTARSVLKFQQQINATGTVYDVGQFDASGNLILSGSAKVANDVTAASASNVGAIRYRVSGTTSYCEQVMQTAAATYAWVVIKSNTW